jgi:hypothetical protein
MIGFASCRRVHGETMRELITGALIAVIAASSFRRAPSRPERAGPAIVMFRVVPVIWAAPVAATRAPVFLDRLRASPITDIFGRSAIGSEGTMSWILLVEPDPGPPGLVIPGVALTLAGR